MSVACHLTLQKALFYEQCFEIRRDGFTIHAESLMRPADEGGRCPVSATLSVPESKFKKDLPRRQVFCHLDFFNVFAPIKRRGNAPGSTALQMGGWSSLKNLLAR